MLIGSEIDPRKTPRLKDYFGALLREPDDEPGAEESPLADVYYTDVRGRLAAHGTARGPGRFMKLCFAYGSRTVGWVRPAWER